MKRLVLLGGGHAHVHVLDAFAREPLAETELLLVTPYARQMYSGMVPGLVAGHYTLDDCVIPLAPLAARAGARLVEAAAVGFDAGASRVALSDGSALDFDAASLDTGPVMDHEAMPGAAEHGLFVRPIEQFTRLLDPLLALAQLRELGIVVVGGGAAGVELALALAFRLGKRARVSLVTGGVAPLPTHPGATQRHVRHALARHGVMVLEDLCTEIADDHVQLGSGRQIVCDEALLAIGTSAPPWLRASGLALDERGFVATGATLQSVSHANVFAAGDVASRVDAPHPKSGVYAVRAGPPLAANLRRFVSGEELRAWQPQKRSLNLLACGERRAIASWGGWSLEGRWVWRWKDRIDRAFVARYSSSPEEPTP